MQVRQSTSTVTLSVNGARVELDLAGHETLLDVLRDRLELRGTTRGAMRWSLPL